MRIKTLKRIGVIWFFFLPVLTVISLIFIPISNKYTWEVFLFVYPITVIISHFSFTRRQKNKFEGIHVYLALYLIFCLVFMILYNFYSQS